LDTISEHLISQEVARRTLDLFQAREVQTWVFSDQDWLVRSRDAPLVAHEEHTVGFAPKVVTDLAPFIGRAAKIVGVSQDHELLARCEKELSAALTEQATVVRSQAYYLDITHPLANKGDGLSALADVSEMSADEIAVIGDGRNDIAMFIRSGFSVAMGNASPEVKANATCVTASNEQEASPKRSSNWCCHVSLHGLRNRW
jgi:Cof subfamily protein (haloacid dehalogenase superfamily)